MMMNLNKSKNKLIISQLSNWKLEIIGAIWNKIHMKRGEIKPHIGLDLKDKKDIEIMLIKQRKIKVISRIRKELQAILQLKIDFEILAIWDIMHIWNKLALKKIMIISKILNQLGNLLNKTNIILPWMISKILISILRQKGLLSTIKSVRYKINNKFKDKKDKKDRIDKIETKDKKD